MSNDVEKRWSDPRQMRRAGLYVVAVVVVTAAVLVAGVIAGRGQTEECRDAAFAICRDPARLLVGIGPPVVLLIGGLGAFVRTYRVWRAGGVWPIWQGAGWILLLLMLAYLGLSSGLLVG
ncbi:hypothetical protein HQO46_01095 [Rhodococcus fascians]|nr:hypothetical protein [Rhodococcus fascians]MBY4235904.1 hypothetical protein [Rhodococcus fascians]MBY4267250.1 hypothetical protein [Rhodococcus fascians]